MMDRELERAYQATYRANNQAAIASQRAAYREANRDKVSGQNAAFRSAHREERAAASRAYALAHPGAVQAYQRRYYLSHRADLIAAASEWARTHRPEANAASNRRRARVRDNGVFAITARDWRRILQRHRQACAYCGRSGVPLQQEHVIPIARGGRHSVGNLVPACQPCNGSKGSKLLVEWRYLVIPGGSFMDIHGRDEELR